MAKKIKENGNIGENPTTALLGKRLKERRKQLGLSQRECAERAGVDTQLIRRVETGQAGMLSENLLKVADALDVSTDYLLRGKVNEGDLTCRMRELSEWEQKCLLDIIESYYQSHARKE